MSEHPINREKLQERFPKGVPVELTPLARRRFPKTAERLIVTGHSRDGTNLYVRGEGAMTVNAYHYTYFQPVSNVATIG